MQNRDIMNEFMSHQYSHNEVVLANQQQITANQQEIIRLLQAGAGAQGAALAPVAFQAARGQPDPPQQPASRPLKFSSYLVRKKSRTKIAATEFVDWFCHRLDEGYLLDLSEASAQSNRVSSSLKNSFNRFKFVVESLL